MPTADEPRLLLIETSGKVGQVAVARGATLTGQRRLDETRRHARDLAPAVAELLAEQGWRPRDLNGVMVSRGPGSYTGLRVGIMSVKVLAYATGCPILGIDTFQVIARQAPAEAQAVDILADAQQDKLYIQRFERSAGNEWTAPSELGVILAPEWLAKRDAAAWVSGPATRQVEARLPAGSRIVDESRRDPYLPGLLHLGLARFRSGHFDDAWTLEPLYARPSSAEEKRTGNADATS
ncbi:MAG: tRNA (adenosine(37)-N6)-threonylcarbamoyltransferase complex dimerization subunit type 1 TsaB [Gemmataceae bacterium]|nr:tRNA (adenosine(37)-N6)-threonylcarbamoyltransferase complex dimerization subunit type 1 TsaB [Gemmataceae bacterium]